MSDSDFHLILSKNLESRKSDILWEFSRRQDFFNFEIHQKMRNFLIQRSSNNELFLMNHKL